MTVKDNLGMIHDASEEYRDHKERGTFRDYVFGAMTTYLTREQMEQVIRTGHACMGTRFAHESK